MFDWNEIVLIGVVALIAIGPKELPAVLRAVGQWTTKIRRMAGEFQSQFQEAMREAEMADLKNQVDEVSHAAKVVSSDFDPLELTEETKLEPQPGPEPDAASATTPESPAVAAPSETRGAAAAEPGGSGASNSSSGQGAVAWEARPVSETQPALPPAEGSGQA
jgi:sec-independent protein translocase protein TatB